MKLLRRFAVSLAALGLVAGVTAGASGVQAADVGVAVVHVGHSGTHAQPLNLGDSGWD